MTTITHVFALILDGVFECSECNRERDIVVNLMRTNRKTNENEVHSEIIRCECGAKHHLTWDWTSDGLAIYSYILSEDR